MSTSQREQHIAVFVSLMVAVPFFVLTAVVSDIGTFDTASQTAQALSEQTVKDALSETAMKVTVENIAENNGTLTARRGMTVSVHLQARLSDGEVIMNTKGEKPFIFRLGDAGHELAAFNSIIEGMHTGSIRRVTVPAAYAVRHNLPGIYPTNDGDIIIYDLELAGVRYDTLGRRQ